MGRKSDRNAQIAKEQITEGQIAQETIKKLHREPIKSAELAAYLSCYSRDKIHFDSKKIKDRIAAICRMSNGILTENMFRKDKSNSRSMYLFPPESHGLLLTILDTGYFDDRKNPRKLSTREKLYRDLTVNTELYLQDEDLVMVKSNPAFIAAQCEAVLYEAVSQIMQRMIGNAMNSDEVIRIKQLRRIYKAMCSAERRTLVERCHLFSSKLVYGHAFEEMPGMSEVADYYKELFGADNLFDYLIGLLALRMRGLDFNALSDDEKMNYRTLYQKAKTEEDPLWVELEHIGVAEVKKEIESEVVTNEKYQRLMQKASDVFDREDPDEKQIFDDLAYIIKLRFMAGQTDERNVRAAAKFYEAAAQRDMFDVLREFVAGDFNTPLTEELKRIRRVSEHNSRG